MDKPYHLWIVLTIGLLRSFEIHSARLESYNCDKDSITVSGLSSGAAMAMQLHIARSAVIKGCGILAGLPFGCALNANEDLSLVYLCMYKPEVFPLYSLISTIDSLELSGKIDNPFNLNGQRVFVFHGLNDTTVNFRNGRNVIGVYEHYNAHVQSQLTIEAQHGFPTHNYGAACDTISPPFFINNCSWNGAFHTLNFLYNGQLFEPMGDELVQELITFNQTEFGASPFNSMSSEGLLYVPSRCRDGTIQCKFHVSLHGCQQFMERIGDAYARHSGYLQVAELNDIIVMFPQTSNITVNPNGCWDWYSYLDFGKDQFLTRDGPQINSIYRMIERVVSI